jgi:hypothetical protein
MTARCRVDTSRTSNAAEETFAMTPPNRCTRPVFLILAGLLALIVIAADAATASAADAPRWQIDSRGMPTHFEPGDESGTDLYEVIVTNFGGGPTDGTPVTLTDTLPQGLTVQNVFLYFYASGFGGVINGGFFCATSLEAMHEVVRCNVPEEFAGRRLADVAPEGTLRLLIFVETPPGASGALENAATVEGGGAPVASTTSVNAASATPAPAGVAGFDTRLMNRQGDPATEAGIHPDRYTTSFLVNTQKGAEFGSVPAAGDVKDQLFSLPAGMIGNPTAAARCTAQQFNSDGEGSTAAHSFNSCPDGSVVGMIHVSLERVSAAVQPVYNLVPPKGMPAQLGFRVGPLPFYINTKVRTGGDYGITAYVHNTTQLQRVIGAKLTLWGVPAATNHSPLRGSCLGENFGVGYSLGSCPAGVAAKPFLRLPTSCSAPMGYGMSFDTWTNPGSFLHATSTEPAPANCARLDFSPTISAVPDITVADSPSGLRFNLHLPQNDDPNLLAEADLRDAVVRLPEGITVNPASANGLAGCSPAQVELNGPEPARCPNASKIGSVEIHTPLLDHPIEGGVYVATPDDNPFNSLLAVYIAVHDPRSGVVVKLAGHVVADPRTGQLTATFDENPQLPFEDFTVDFFDGPRAALRTPRTCGTYATTTDLKPYSAPQSGPDAAPSDSFAVTAAPGGGPCAGSEAAQPHAPSFSAGTLAPVAGAFSPFVTHLSREDGSQILRGLDVALPPGLLGKLAGVPYCPQAAIDAAGARSGRDELAAPSCPPASQVGTATVGAGAGPSPVYVQGRAYLAGPYKGAPLSLAVVTPAVAGPYDLGTVVVRVALHVNPETAQITATSDPLPTILEGIPLDLRSIDLRMDRPQFTLNPTNCEAMSVTGTAFSVLGQAASFANRFQVGGCRGLDFHPHLSVRLKGGTRRTAHPKLIATVYTKPGEANIARAQVRLAHSAFLDQAHIRTICTRVQFAAGGGNGEECPPASVYGHAWAKTPLLDHPLGGKVLLRSSNHQLPDLVVALQGPPSQPIAIDLDGRTDSVKGALRNTFEAVPDAPVSKFRLVLFGGKHGLVINSRTLCAKRDRANVRFVGQNGKVSQLHPLIRNSCGKPRKTNHKRRLRGHNR